MEEIESGSSTEFVCHLDGFHGVLTYGDINQEEIQTRCKEFQFL
jgi:hypothetical protein